MSITSTLIPVSSTPTSETDVWALAYLFRVHWGEDVTVRSSFLTDISAAITMSEQRQGLRVCPVRSVSFTLQAFDREESLCLKMLAARAGVARSLVPLVSDQCRITSPLPSGSNTIPCDRPHLYRFSPGARAVVIGSTSEASAPLWEVVTVDEVVGSTIEIENSTSNSYGDGAFVLPLIEARVVTLAGGDIVTDHHTRLVFEAMEAVGPTQLDLLPPGTYDTYQGLTICPLSFDFSNPISWSNERSHDSTTSGIDEILSLYGARGRVGFNGAVTCTAREQAVDAIRFFEHCRGTRKAFWLRSPSTDYTLESIASNGLSITVAAVGEEVDWSMRPYVAIEYLDGTVSVREIESVARTSDSDQVFFSEEDEPLEETDENEVSRVCVAYKSRFASDEFVEGWLTDDKMVGVMAVTELLEEKEINIEELTEVTTSPLTGAYTPGACSGSVSINCEEGCTPALTLPFLESLPDTFDTEADPAQFEDCDECLVAPVGTPVWDGTLVKDYDPTTLKVYRLPSNPLSFDGYLLDYARSGIFWIPPHLRTNDNVCWDLRIIAQQGVTPLPDNTPITSPELGFNLANKGFSDREWMYAEFMAGASFRPEQGWYARFVDSNGHYPRNDALPNKGWTVASDGGFSEIEFMFGSGMFVTLHGSGDPEAVEIWPPGYGPGEPREFQKFHQTFIDRLAPAGVVRLLDVLNINDSGIEDWADRTQHDIPWEDLIEFANSYGKILYVQIPHKATSDYITNLANLLLASLDPSLFIYLEWSNEVWNAAAFQQYHDVKAWADDAGKTLHRVWAEKMKAAFDIFHSVFSGEESRVQRVLACQAANAYHARRLITELTAIGGAWDVMAINPYLAISKKNTALWNSSTSTDQMIDALFAKIDIAEGWWREHFALCEANGGKPLIAYEGGQHLSAFGGTPSWYNAYVRLQTHPRMYDLYIELLTRWRLAGGGLFIHYTFVQMISKFGQWGAMDYMDYPVDDKDTPKMNALVDFHNP